MTDLPSLARTRFRKTYRIVRSIYPPIDLFEDIADPGDWELLAAAEAKTNPRVRDQIGAIHLVPPERRVSGPGASWVMAAFTHISPLRASRFSDGSYGVYYAARLLKTAVREVSFHTARFMSATNEEPIAVDLRCYRAAVRRPVHELRGMREALPGVYAPDSYADSQRLGASLRAMASWGAVYESVRDPGGECVALFRPPALGPAVQGQHITLLWDGAKIGSWYVKSDLRRL